MSVKDLNYRSAVGKSNQTSATRMFSPSVWTDCPYFELVNGLKDGFAFFDDFAVHGLNLATNATTATSLGNGWYGSTANGTSVVRTSATAPTGVVELFATDDNQDSIISALCGGNIAGQVLFASTNRVWMEARIKRSVITDSKFGIYVGFAEEALCDTTEVIAATGTLADKDYVGFHALEADGDKFDLVYNTASSGNTPVTIEADSATIVADTWTKLGMYFDGTTLTFYQDGVSLATALPGSDTDFPDDQEMAFYIAQMPAHADDATTSVDWVRIAREIVA